ncbi:MAG: adenylate/guanylate cyclase domain-containing protein [Betaproteobacteria bacterium]
MKFQPAGLLRRLAEAPRWLIGLAIVGAFLADPLLDARSHAARTPLFAKLEAIAYDMRLAFTRPNAGDAQVVIIDIDEKSLQREGRWPWGRDKMARLAERALDRYQARVLGFDVVFSERDTSGGLAVLDDLATGEFAKVPGFTARVSRLRAGLDHDARFAEAMRGRAVVLGYGFPLERQAVGALPPPAFREADLGTGRIPIAPEVGYTANLGELQRAAAGAGHFDPVFDSDNVIRRVPLVKRYGDGFYPALAVAVTQVALEAKTVLPRFDESGQLEALDVGGLVLPVARDGTALVPYRGPGRTFRYFSATDILAGTVPAATFTGAIALVGTTAKGLYDLRSTPMGPDFPGVEVHANLVAGMLNDELKSIPADAAVIEALVMLAAGLLVVFAVAWRSPVFSVVGVAAVAATVIAVNLAFWTRAGAVIPLAPTLVMLVVLLMWNLLSGFFRETRAMQQLSDLFGEYVPKERVAQMRETGERFSMEGDSRELTVLFSDVRDFTALSERLAPRELSAMMNAYLTPMTEIVHYNRGTIDKYIGDAIMAFWGAPLVNPRHAHDAVASAITMQQKMQPLAAQFRDRGWPALAIGIGLNTGPMNVGDMGSQFRKAYTVLGDAVNLGSRLEGLTKSYGIGILCGEDTRNAAPEFVWREVDRVRVKGRAQALGVWEPLGETVSPAGAAELARWHEALALYRDERFAEAGAIVVTLPPCPLYERFRARCANYLEHPPPSGWDGATNFATK